MILGSVHRTASRGGRRARRAAMTMAFIVMATAAPVGSTPLRDPAAVGTPPLRLIVAPSPQGVQRVLPGAVIARAVIGRPDAVVLGADIALDWRGARRILSAGQILHAETIYGGPAEQAMFCEDERRGSVGKALTGQMLWGLVAALQPTALETRYCVYDEDADGRFDHAMLLGARGKTGRAPFPIPAAVYQLIEGLPLGGDSIIRLRYAGAAGAPQSVSVDTEVQGFGRMREVATPRSRIALTRLPARATIAGAVVTILDYDRATGEATLRIDHELAPGHLILPDLARGY